MVLVSIIIPVLNSGESLRSCLESVLQQTFSDVEVLVVDDHSTDLTTLEILYDFVKNDHRVKLTLNPANHGVASCRNLGVSLITGDYFAFVDSYDCLEPDFIDRMYHTLEANGSDFAVCSVKNVTSDPAVASEPDLNFPLHADPLVKTADFVRSDMFMGVPCSAVGKMFRTDSYNQAGLNFREDLLLAEDQDWTYRVFCQLQSFSVLDFVGLRHMLHAEARKLVLSESNLMDEIHALAYKYDILKQHGLVDLHNAAFFQQCCAFASKVEQETQDPELKQRLFTELMQAFGSMGYDINLFPSKSELFKAGLAYKAYKLLPLSEHKIMAKARYDLYAQLLKEQ